MDAAVFKAAIPEPFRIFGVQLLSLSLGRYRLLKRFGVAFVSEEETHAEVSDLLLGIFICSMRCQEFLGLLEDTGRKGIYHRGREALRGLRPGKAALRPRSALQREFQRWGKRIRKEIKADRHFSLFAKFGLFRFYLKEAATIPPYWEENSDGMASGAHWSHSVEVTLRSELGWSREEIEEAPLSKAIADYFKWSESQGLIRLIAPGETEMAEANARALAGVTVPTSLAEALQNEEVQSPKAKGQSQKMPAGMPAPLAPAPLGVRVVAGGEQAEAWLREHTKPDESGAPADKVSNKEGAWD